MAVAPNGDLWASTEAGALVRVDVASSTAEVVMTLDAQLMGICFDDRGRIYCCAYDCGKIVRVDPVGGDVRVYSTGRLRNPNWAVFDEIGNLIVSDSGSERLADRDGRILVIPPGGGAGEIVPTRPLHYANGLALAPDGTLFVTESFSSRISSYRSGALETYAELDGTIPDGLALDEDGGLFVSCFQPNRVLRIPPGGGEPVTIVDDWTGQEMLTPTNVAFMGDGRQDLAIASLCGWSLSAVTLRWRGQRLHHPHIP